jgi:intracellular sulfur oxidation DsrE/DsrF family protein
VIKKVIALVFSLAFVGLAGTSAAAAEQSSAGGQQLKVVYHINNSKAQALAGLRNIRNELDVAPNAKVVVVAHSNGVDFLMEDYKDAAKVKPLVAALAARGVDFEVCEITMKRRHLTKDQFLLEANFTPSGVVLLTKLQNEGYAYIKP